MKLKSIIPLALAGAALASCGSTQTPPEEIVKHQSGFKDAIVERYNVDNGTNLQSQNIELKGLDVISVKNDTQINAKISFWEANDTITNMYVATVENYVGPSKVCDAMDYITENASSLTVSYESYACPNSLKAEMLKLEHAGTNRFIKVARNTTYVDSQINNIILKKDSNKINFILGYTVIYKDGSKTLSRYYDCDILITDRMDNKSASENMEYVFANCNNEDVQQTFMTTFGFYDNKVNEIVSDYTIANFESELKM